VNIFKLNQLLVPKAAFTGQPSFQVSFNGDICVYKKRQSPVKDLKEDDYWLTYLKQKKMSDTAIEKWSNILIFLQM